MNIVSSSAIDYSNVEFIIAIVELIVTSITCMIQYIDFRDFSLKIFPYLKHILFFF